MDEAGLIYTQICMCCDVSLSNDQVPTVQWVFSVGTNFLEFYKWTTKEILFQAAV